MGRWHLTAYESGTTNVSDDSRGPWLYVYVPGDDIEDSRNRYAACEQVAAFLNGDGPRPEWLDDMERICEDTLRGSDGSFVEACGPMFDANPPACQWETCQDDESKDARARLIDRLVLRESALAKEPT